MQGFHDVNREGEPFCGTPSFRNPVLGDCRAIRTPRFPPAICGLRLEWLSRFRVAADRWDGSPGQSDDQI